ncbi:hypothetical protein ACXR2U_14880 [Jatrophihabitans sp. YIM 134969]
MSSIPSSARTPSTHLPDLVSGDFTRRVATNWSPLAGRSRHSPVVLGLMVVLVALVGTAAAGAPTSAVILTALVLGATVLRLVLRVRFRVRP